LWYVLFSGLSWKLVQNIWIRPEYTPRAIWSFLEFKVDPEKIKIGQGSLIDRLLVEPTSISRDAIDRFSKHHKIDRSKSINRHYIRSIDFGSSRRSWYFQIFVRSKSKFDFYGHKWTPTSYVCAARIDSWWHFVNPILFKYEG
jgi:hypothetical protein